jgi:hypothetical protein
MTDTQRYYLSWSGRYGIAGNFQQRDQARYVPDVWMSDANQGVDTGNNRPIAAVLRVPCGTFPSGYFRDLIVAKFQPIARN